MDALLLSRIQFGFVISFHILFPAFTIGLASWLMFLEWRWLRTRDGVWWDLYKFWSKVFAISFGMGVVSGIVMSFQFGTNWSVLSERAGNVLGPLLSYEVLTAFFLEAGFLGVMLFGAQKVRPVVHLFCTCMVALGTLISTFWIIAAISWMHTPQGHVLQGGVFSPGDWWAIIFNPSFPYRLAHMVLAAFITTCFVIGGTAAWHLRGGVQRGMALKMLKLSIAFGAIAVPAQVLMGDQHGLNTLEHQPIKVAAMEAHWHAGPPGAGVPLVLFAVPRQAEARNDFEVAIPRLGSLILTHSLDGEILALTSVAPADRPPVLPVFVAFRVMVGIGMLMLLVVAASCWAWWRGRLAQSAWVLRGWQLLSAAGFVALLAGWWVTEMGRQPWVIYGLLRTADAVSPNLQASTVAASLAGYAVVYAIIFGAGIWYLWRLLKKGPQAGETPPSHGSGAKTPARPMSAAGEADIAEGAHP
ncbi:cytochrome ubiquinol oxidase subunit I [Ottowia testudinis]|uniref:Cytochrome ubiquinol oxidase subunit I n=1 Tax=Ottowia testudinis TaxID=2816950 RepID=A0A975CGY3_9BURK|nr:cytochrome ubiquinol oxidase subunit I [Ottowia testudinis]QTD44707.1 cytochrome ubiquinol oxidase subunit I [Ottowia testudinis]